MVFDDYWIFLLYINVTNTENIVTSPKQIYWLGFSVISDNSILQDWYLTYFDQQNRNEFNVLIYSPRIQTTTLDVSKFKRRPMRNLH